jgi:hypothetical protein
MASLGGPHLYGGERTGVGSENSISYGAQKAPPNTDENNPVNSAMIQLELTPLGQTSDMVTRFNASSHKFCKKGSFSPTGPLYTNVALQSGANTKLNFFAATSTNILLRSRKSKPRIVGKIPSSIL